MKGSTSSPQSQNCSISDLRHANASSMPTPGQALSLQAATLVVSQHSLKMQQIDQQQQALYQQYLKSSPASAPEGPSYCLQSTASIMLISNNNLSTSFRSQGGHPGSLILVPNGLDSQGVLELSVIQVFTGPNLHTEVTFKTVLLNALMTSSDLIQQAMQRFWLAAGEDEADYYLEIKQVEGQSAVLLPHEKPLGVFEGLNTWDLVATPCVVRMIPLCIDTDIMDDSELEELHSVYNASILLALSLHYGTIYPGEHVVMAQLYCKVEELQEANAELGARNCIVHAWLAHAKHDMLEIKCVYDEIGEEIGAEADVELSDTSDGMQVQRARMVRPPGRLCPRLGQCTELGTENLIVH